MATKAVIAGPELEFARSMEIAQIPEKLRCAICNRLAVNPLKLACCDTSVCGDCHESLSASECPVCSHAPFDKETVTPSRALQTTVKVFLKTEAKKRGIDLRTGDKIVATPKPAPQEAVTPAAEIASTTPVNAESLAAAPTVEAEPSGEAEAPAVEEPSAVNGESAPAAETSTDETHADGHQEEQEADDESDDEDDVVITTERPEHDEEQQDHGGDQTRMQHNGRETPDQNVQMDQQQSFGGFDQNMNGFGNNTNFGNMNMMNQMMGMPGFGGMSMPNMMGMPNMGMDPSMMFNGNFGGMDMSAMINMGMGMGMGGMNGGMAAGMSDFNGIGGPGFFPNQGNYAQSNAYGNGTRTQNPFNDRGYGRGYGRGFGRGARGNQFGRGRGGWGFQQQHQYGQNQQFGQTQAVRPQSSSGANATDVVSQRRASPSYDAGQGQDGTSTGPREISQGTANNGDPDAMDTNDVGTNGTDDNADHIKQNGDVDMESQDPQQVLAEGEANKDASEPQFDDGVKQIGGGSMQVGPLEQSSAYNDFDSGMQNQKQYARSQHAINGSRGGGRGGRGGYGNLDRGTDAVVALTPTPAPPPNAPSGPKAMREGRPNTAWAGRQAAMKPAPTPAPEVKAPSQAPEAMRMEDIKQEEQGYDRSRSQSRTGRDVRREVARGAEDDNESDETYARRKERERRKRKERDGRYDEERNGSRDADKSSKKYRSRSESRADDGSRRRHRDKDDEHRSSRSHRERSKDRHHRRHRSKSPARESEAQDEHSRRKNRGDRERDDYDERKESRRSHKHSRREDNYCEDERKDRSHHRSSKHDRPSRDERPREPEPASVIVQPDDDDDVGFKIKGRKKLGDQRKDRHMPPPSRERRPSVAEQSVAVASDPYAAERARAQQGREAKEALRRQSTQSSSLGKRGRDEDEIDAPRGPKGDRGRIKKGKKERRISYKYEDEVGVDERDSWR